MLFHIINIVVSVCLSVVMAVVAGYASHASVDMSKNDKKSHTANSILTTVSVLGWISVVAAIVSFAGMIMFPEEIMASRWLRLVVNGMVYILLVMLLVLGILMAVAAGQIRGSSDYSANKAEYKYTVNGAVVALVVSISLAIAYIGTHVYDRYRHGSGKMPMSQKLQTPARRQAWASLLGGDALQEIEMMEM